MNLEQLHQYLDELIDASTDQKSAVILPGEHIDGIPNEVADVMLVPEPADQLQAAP